MLKESETEETIDFRHIFVISDISRGGGGGGPPVPLWLRICRTVQ